MKIFVKILNFVIALFKLVWFIISFPFKVCAGIMELIEIAKTGIARSKNI